MTPLQTKLRQLKYWFTEKIRLINLWFESKDNPRKLIPRMGNIYWAKLGINIGSELDKNRPVLIFQGNDWYLKNSDLVFIFPITSTQKERKYAIPFSSKDIREGNMRSGQVLIQQGRAISKFRLGRKIARIDLKILEKVQQQMKLFFSKNTPLETNPEGDNHR